MRSHVAVVRCSLMEASLVVLSIAFCIVVVPFVYRFCNALYRFCIYVPLFYYFCTSLEKDCFNIATKGIATKRIATKRIATKKIATKGFATKGIAFPDLSDLCEKHMFLKNGHNSSPRGSPDMILTAFDRKFHEKKNEIPPGACNPSYTFICPILEI